MARPWTDRRSAVFDHSQWRMGTRGTMGSVHSPRAQITDMRLYPDGSLGPRPRYKRFGQPLSATTYGDAATNTIFPALQRDSYVATVKNGWLILQTNGVRFSYDSGSHLTILGPIVATDQSGGPNSWVSRISDYEWLINRHYVKVGHGVALTATDTGAALATRFAGAATYTFEGSCVHQGRAYFWGPMITAGIPANENRVYYTDAASYTTFTSATQFFDIDGSVAGAMSTGANLLIWTNGGSWYILQGRGNPASGTLSKIGGGGIPPKRRQPGTLDNALVFERAGLTGLVSVGPAGSMTDDALSYLAFQGSIQDYSGTAPPKPVASSIHNVAVVPDLLSRAGSYMLHNGIWVKERIGVSLATDCTFGMNDDLGRDTLHVWNGTAWLLYERQLWINAPEPNVGGDPFSESPTGKIELPAIQDQGGHQVRIIDVTVDGSYWKGATYDTPAMTCQAVDGKGTTVTFVQGPTSALIAGLPNATGSSYRFKFTPPSGATSFTAQADVVLTGLVGFTVDSVAVEYEVNDGTVL